jgi:hypothetical protein
MRHHIFVLFNLKIWFLESMVTSNNVTDEHQLNLTVRSAKHYTCKVHSLIQSQVIIW